MENLSIMESLGNIDFCKNGVLSGWFACNGKSDLTNLVLTINGVDIEAEAVSKDRADVVLSVGCDIDCGFEFDLTGLETDGLVRISIYHQTSGFEFNNISFLYNRLIDKYTGFLKQLLMPEYYRNRYTLSSLSNEEIIEHYLDVGIYKNLDPNPWFSSEYFLKHYPDLLDSSGIAIISYLENESGFKVRASQVFDTIFYGQKYRDQLHVESSLVHYVQFGQYEGRMIQNCAPGDILRKQVLDACEIEPKCQMVLSKLDRVVRYPKILPSLYAPLTLKHKYEDRIKVIVTVPFVSLGGADLISTFVLKALQHAYGREEVLLLVTEHESVEVPDWIAGSSNIEILNQLSRFRSDEHKVQALHSIVGLLSPEKLININSRATWELIRDYGKQLNGVLDLYAYLFCFDYDQNRIRVGYIPEYLPETIHYFKKLLCDNRNIINEIGELYGFSQENMSKLETVYVPLPDNMGESIKGENTAFRKKILWIGRLSEQKRPDLLLKIANCLKDYEFHVYGPAGNSACSESITNSEHSNIFYHGVFVRLDEIDVNQYDLYLNTSEWEGLPTILIQIMALGLPIITSNAGGITELVDEKTGVVIENLENTEDFVRAVLGVRANYESAIARSRAGLARIDSQHSWKHFYTKLVELGLVEASDTLNGNIPSCAEFGAENEKKSLAA